MLVVVGNKIDKADEETISYQDAKQYADSVGAMLKLTSAKDGKGINVVILPIRNCSQLCLRNWRRRRRQPRGKRGIQCP